jgi:organic radical activating enzyme
MFGKNEVAKVRPAGDGLLVHSIFYTIQGEGPWAGLPAIFVRLAGCNLRCFWCDTDFAGGKVYSPTELAEAVYEIAFQSGCERVVLTGGEPMLQEAVVPFFYRLSMPAAFQAQIETAGTCWPPGLEELPSVIIVCSPKTPRVLSAIRTRAKAWKYIIRAGEVSEEDGLPFASTQLPGMPALLERPPEIFPRSRVYVQACDEGDAEATQANLHAAAASAMKFGYRLSVQMHKLAGLE